MDSVEAGTSTLLRGPLAKLTAELHHHPKEFDIQLRMDPGDREFLQFKLQKPHQLQLRTLFHACKKATAAAAADAAASAGAHLAPLPRVPVLSLRIAVQQGALHSAYLAADKPFPTRSRHTWAHEPYLARNQTVSRREVSSRFRTVAHQFRDLRFEADPRLPQKPDPELGATGCVMDMLASDTEFFGCQRYFLTINAAPRDPNASGPAGVTIVRVTAQVELRTVAPPKEEVLRAEAEAKAMLSKKQQLIRAATIAEKNAAAAEAARQLAQRKEEQRHLEEAAAEQRKIQDTEAAEAASAVAAARAARAIAEAAALAGSPSPDADDPFAESPKRGSPRARIGSQAAEEKYPDPFGDEPSLSKQRRMQEAEDPFAAMDDDDNGRPNRGGAGAPDPFASFPPSPARGPKVSGGGGRNPLDDLDSLQNSPAAARPSRAQVVPPVSLSSSRPVVNRELDLATRPVAVLSPNVLESLPSRRPSPAATPSAENSLSLAGTPVVKPVKKDARVLDNLPTLSGARVQIQPPRPTPVVSRAELSVPLSSLPDRSAPRKVDVLSSVPTPPISPRSRHPPTESISALPTPVMRPKPSPAVLDSVAAPPAAAKPNPRVLDALPSPAKARPKLAADLDALPLPPLSLAAPRTAPPAGPNALDEVDAAPARGGGVLRKPTVSSAAAASKRSPQKPIAAVSASQQRRDVLDDSSDSLFGDSPARPAASASASALKRQPTAVAGSRANPLDDDAFWDSSPAPAAAVRRAPTMATRPAVSFADGLDDDLLATPTASKRVAANLNVLDDL